MHTHKTLSRTYYRAKTTYTCTNTRTCNTHIITDTYAKHAHIHIKHTHTHTNAHTHTHTHTHTTLPSGRTCTTSTAYGSGYAHPSSMCSTEIRTQAAKKALCLATTTYSTAYALGRYVWCLRPAGACLHGHKSRLSLGKATGTSATGSSGLVCFRVLCQVRCAGFDTCVVVWVK